MLALRGWGRCVGLWPLGFRAAGEAGASSSAAVLGSAAAAASKTQRELFFSAATAVNGKGISLSGWGLGGNSAAGSSGAQERGGRLVEGELRAWSALAPGPAANTRTLSSSAGEGGGEGEGEGEGGEAGEAPALASDQPDTPASADASANDIAAAAKKGDRVIFPKSYEEAEDAIFEMAEELLPNVDKPVYNVWDRLPEDEREGLPWAQGGDRDKKRQGRIGRSDDSDESSSDSEEVSFSDAFADIYERDQWGMDAEIEDLLVADGKEAGEAAADAAGAADAGEAKKKTTLRPVTEWEETIFEWEYSLVLHPHAVALPRHPLNNKVRLKVNLENLRQYYDLSEEEKSHIALICGPRYKSKTDSIFLTTQTHASRVDNQKHLMKIVKDLVDEAKSFVQ